MVRRFWNGRWANAAELPARQLPVSKRRVGYEAWIMRCTASRERLVRFEYGA